MEAMKWTADLSVGNEEIDEDHRKLFDLIEELRVDMQQGRANKSSREIVDALTEYSEKHFSREEAFMLKIGYPQYAAHKADHDRFVSELYSLQSRLDRGALTLTQFVDQLLNDWLRRHVLVMDKALAAYLHAK